jgi:secondary thiamine-phosphate synthase enzyme
MKIEKINIVLEKEFTDITEVINTAVKDIKTGLVTISSMHTTCGLKVMENELLSLHDIDNYLEEQSPKNGEYAHDKIHLRQVPLSERINGYSHVRMLHFESSITIPVQDGKLLLGVWQTLFAVEMDGMPPRKREFIIVIQG